MSLKVPAAQLAQTESDAVVQLTVPAQFATVVQLDVEKVAVVPEARLPVRSSAHTRTE